MTASYFGSAVFGVARFAKFPDVLPSTFHQSPTYVVYIGGIATTVVEVHTSHSVDEPIGSLTIVVALPLPGHVVENAVVEVHVDNGDRAARIFHGSLRVHDKRLSDDGMFATITGDGFGYLLAYKSEEDKAFAWDSAETEPVEIVSAPIHVGDETLAHYADDAPNGTTVSISGVGCVASSFVLVEGRAHGSNSTNDDETLVMTVASRIEIWQGASKRGSAPMPVIAEQWVDQLDEEGAPIEPPPDQVDFSIDANWSDFSVVVPVRTLEEGEMQVRFVSGTISNGQRDEFEVKSVDVLTAVPVNPHEIIRGLARERGFMGGGGPNYAGEVFVDVDGDEILVGGNGLVDNGQIRVEKNTSWLDYVTEISNLFGYRSFDCPDGKFRTRKYRGLPDVDPATTFTEGVDALDIGYTRDTRPVINFVEVLGASGNDNEGQAFQYRSVPDEIPANVNIPNPPGVAYMQLSNDLLVSNELCEQVREINEVDYGDVYQEVSWSSFCHPWVHPAMVALLDFPSLGLDEVPFWITSVKTDISDDGIWSSYTGWIGSGSVLPGEDDCHYVPLRLGGGTASRLYLTGDAPTYHPTTLRGSWNDGTHFDEGSLDVSPTPDLHRSTVEETSSSNTWDVLLFRGTSAPLDVAQTINGTVRFGANVSQLAESANMRGRLHIFVTVGSTNVVRGTLLNGHEEDEHWPNSSRGVETSPLTLSSVAASVGDRIVVEMGYRAENTTTSPRSGRLHYGGRDLGDAKDGSNEKGSAWLEFSNLIAPGKYRHGAVIHIGDDTVAWYARPTPNGLTHSAYFQLAADFTSITIHGLIHGSNSFLLTSHHEDSVPSKVELWQDGTLIGESLLPVLAEGSSSRDYDETDRYWTNVALPITGQFEAGEVEVRFVSGTSGSTEPNEPDEYEVKIASVEICGDRLPTLPDIPTTPVIPPPKPLGFDITILSYVPATIVLDADAGDATYPSSYLFADDVTIPSGTRYLRVSATATALRQSTKTGTNLLIEPYATPQMGVVWSAEPSTTRPWFETGVATPRIESGTGSVEFVWEYDTDVDVPGQSFTVVSHVPADGGASLYTLSNIRLEAYGELAPPPYVHKYQTDPTSAPLYANRWTYYASGGGIRIPGNDLYIMGTRSARDTSRKVQRYTDAWQLHGRLSISDAAATVRVGLGDTPSTMDYYMELTGTGSFTLHTPTGNSTSALTTPTFSLGTVYEWFMNYKTSTGLVIAQIGVNPMSTNGTDATAARSRGKPLGKNLYLCYSATKNVNDAQEDVALFSTVGPGIDLRLNESTFRP